jgi:hypothetical protein
VKRSNPAIDAFIATARKYVGYKSELLGRNIFGERVGYDSTVWSGAFIDVIARESGLDLPSFVYSPAALAEFLRNNQTNKRPRPGDIAIFNFSSVVVTNGSNFASPHVGLVVDTRELTSNGRFLTIEGNVTGSTSYQAFDGVHQRIRYVTDVVIFCRPANFEPMVRKLLRDAAAASFKLTAWVRTKLSAAERIELAQIQEASTQLQTVDIKKLQPGTKNKHVTAVQLALGLVTDISGAEEGKWDQATASAFARFQRTIGRVGPQANGAPEEASLQRLAKQTGLFALGTSTTVD